MKAALKPAKILVLVLSLFLSVCTSFAQSTLWSNSITGTNPGQTNPFKAGEISQTNIAVSGIGRGSTVAGLNSLNNYGVTNWPNATTIDLNAYFEFSITPNPGYKIAVSSFNYTATSVNKSPQLFTFRSNFNGDNFNTNIGTASLNGNTINLLHESISTSTNYRLYGWKAGNGSGRNWSVNDFSFSGSVLGSATTSLTTAGYQYGASASPAQSFQVNGAGLTSNTITISGSGNFEVSTTSASAGFGSTANLTAIAGTLLPATVWVRLKTGRNAGIYSAENITISCGNILNIPVSCTATVTVKPLNIINAAAQNKIYNRTNSAVITGTISGIVGTDNVVWNGTGTFATINAGNGITVISNATLGGTHAANYSLTQPTGLTANIVVRSLTPGISVNDKIYDGNTVASLNGNISLQNLISPDVITATASSLNFINKNAGVNKQVNAAGITLSGSASVLQNYSLSSTTASTTASITTKILTVTATASNKVYDGMRTAAIVLSDNRISNDQINISYSASLFADSNAAQNKNVVVTGLSLSGTDASNYLLTNNFINTQANITARSLTISANSANKIFGTIDPQFSYQVTNGQLVSGDVITGTLNRLAGETVGTYSILQGSISINPNYQIIYQPSTFTINPRNIIVSVIPGNIICYGGNTALSCSVSGAGIGVQYSLNNGPSQSSGNFIVPAGAYVVTATDADGFSAASSQVVVTEPAAIASSFSVTACGSYALPWGGIVTNSGSFVNTYTSVNGCDSVVNANVIIDTVGNAISGPVNSCRYTSPSGDIATYSIVASNPSSVIWTVPSNTTIISGQGTTSLRLQFNPAFTSGTVSVKLTRSCGGTVLRSLIVTKAVPVAGVISGPVNACPMLETATSATYSVPNSVNVMYYKWNLSRGLSYANNDSVSNSISLNFQSGYTSYSLSVNAVSGCAASDTSKLIILVSKPAAPVVITGETNACPFIGADTVLFYKTPKVISRGKYVWTVPQGISIMSYLGGYGTLNDTIIGVKFDSSFVSGSFITVQTISPCGLSLMKNLTITRSSAPLPSVIYGPANTCSLKVGTDNPHGANVVYKINKVRFATSYNWILPAGVTRLSRNNNNANDTSITVRFESNFSGGTIGVQSKSGCGVSIIRTLAVKDVVLGMPGAISGPTNPCPLIGGPDTTCYRINKVAGATKYNWTVPEGAFIVARPGIEGTENDTMIIVKWTSDFNTGSVKVVPQNNCSVSRSPRTLTILKKIPGVPGVITGPSNPCVLPGNISTYSIAANPINSEYIKWTAPSNAVIIGSDTSLSVKVSFSNNFNSGTLTVKGMNNCTSGTAKSLSISNKVASVPGAISSTVVSVCPARMFIYSILSMPTDAISIQWSVPEGGTIISGQGTTSVTVSYTGMAIAGVINVTSIDGCNRSAIIRSLAVDLPSCPISSLTSGAKQHQSINSGIRNENEISLSINSSAAGFTFFSNADIQNVLHVRLCDISGRLIEQFDVQSNGHISFGLGLKSGVYFMEMRQGAKRLVKQLFKP